MEIIYHIPAEFASANQKTEDRNQKSEDGNQKTEIRKQIAFRLISAEKYGTIISTSKGKEDARMDMSTVSAKGSPKSFMVCHEDPARLHEGTLAPHAYFIPFPEGADPFSDRTLSPRFELLNGDWGFTYCASVIDLEDDFCGKKSEGTIPVPSVWQLHGYDVPQYTNVQYPIPYDPPYVPDDDPVGVYKRSYAYSPDGLRRILCFEGADSCIYLYINGVYAGYSQVSHSTSEFDVTGLLKEGENEITVKL